MLRGEGVGHTVHLVPLAPDEAPEAGEGVDAVAEAGAGVDRPVDEGDGDVAVGPPALR